MTELHLRRIDLYQVGTTGRKCLQILPPLKEGVVQKVVVGAQSGVVSCIERKKGDTKIEFKSTPGPKVDCVALGGALGSVRDKIFVAAGGTIKGFSRKGRQFFGFETNLTENVSAMYIYGVDMLLCGTHSFNHYHDTKETAYYHCGDKINDVICLPIVEGSWVGRGLTPVIACEDRTIKVLEKSDLVYQIEVAGAPTVLHLFDNTGGPEGSLVLYGTRDGKIGLVDLPRTDPSVKWEVTSASSSAGVAAIDCYDILGDDQLELIVGRDDGTVDIYVFDAADRPVLKYNFHCNESINALQCGRVNNANFDEIIVCTYAGWVFGLTTEPPQKQLGSEQPSVAVDQAIQSKITLLREDLDKLGRQVAEERKKYQESTQSKDGVSAVPVFSVNDKFVLTTKDAAYVLTIELQIPMDYVMIQCDVPVDLLDVEKNSAVVSVTPCEPGSSNSMLATYRCQANTTRLEMKIRSIEGQYGTLQAYVAPRVHPKTCQVRQYQIKPLSLHQRCHKFDETIPANVLKLSGNFTFSEAHSWAAFCLPDVPEKPPADDNATFYFQSTFIRSQLKSSYKRGEATFTSDNVSTIAILKDVLSKETTRRKIKLDISCDFNEESVVHVLKLVHPMLEYQIGLAKKQQFLEALRELSMKEDDLSFLSPEYKAILGEADKVTAEYKSQQAHLERLHGIVTDLFIDKFKFKGQNVKQRIPALLEQLEKYNFPALVEFFESQ